MSERERERALGICVVRSLSNCLLHFFLSHRCHGRAAYVEQSPLERYDDASRLAACRSGSEAMRDGLPFVVPDRRNPSILGKWKISSSLTNLPLRRHMFAFSQNCARSLHEIFERLGGVAARPQATTARMKHCMQDAATDLGVGLPLTKLQYHCEPINYRTGKYFC